MSHIHVIDNKQITYPNATCPICHPEQAQVSTPAEKEVLPRVYRKGSTVVVKLSKGVVLTVGWWSEGTAYLLGISKMARDAQKRVMIDQNKLPIWNKTTVRLSTTTLNDFIMELSKLVSDTQASTEVPTRA